MSSANFSLSIVKVNESELHIAVTSQRLEDWIKTQYLCTVYKRHSLDSKIHMN